MSFVKLPRKYAGRSQYGHNTKRKKKPHWDDSINDLSVHKATKEELDKRKEATTSKNMDLVKADIMKKKLTKSYHHHHRSGRTPGRKRKTALLKEVLYDSSQLNDVLVKSDRMMHVVRDLFGDDPMKYQGLPHVTSAPNRTSYQSYDSTLPEGSIIEEPSKLDMLSESIMDKSALNEVESEYSDSDYEDVIPSYQSKLDLGRFQHLLTQAEAELEKDKKKQHSRGGGDSLRSSSMAKELAELLAKNPKLNTGQLTPTTAVELTSPVSAGPGAINDTLKVKKTMSRLTEQEKSSMISADVSNHNDGSFNLDSLRKVLNGLESNVRDYEKMTGRQPEVKQGDVEDGNTLTGFTGRLVSAVNKVSRYLKENELRLKAETTLREHLHSDVMYLKTLVDTLTNDIITTQEQYVSLQSEFVRYKNEAMDQITAIKQGLESRGIQIHPIVLPVPQKPAVFPSAHPELMPGNPMQMCNGFQNQEGLPRNPLHNLSSRVPDLSKQIDDQARFNPVNGSVQSAMALGIPQQSDSPKAMGKHRSKIQDEQLSVSQPLRNSYTMNQSSTSQQVHNGIPQTQLSYSNFQQPLYDHLKQAVARIQPTHTVNNSDSYMLENNKNNNPRAFQPLLSDSQQLSDTSVRMAEIAEIQNLPQPDGNWTRNVQMQGTGTGLLHLTEPIPMMPLPQLHVGRNSGIESQRSSEFETVQNAGAGPVRNANTNPLKPNGGELDIPGEMSSNLERQIEELNKQHAEAQSKLQQLMYQQEVVENNMTVKNHQLVSPPISPITVGSDTETQSSVNQHSMIQQQSARNLPSSVGIQQQHKHIRVSLPRMENIIDNQN